MYVGPSLPTDRESVFYLNSKAIPSVDKNKLTGNSLQIATQSVIKLFIRPKNLAEAPAHAPSTLRCRNERGQLTITNPSPYYVSMVELYSAGKNCRILWYAERRDHSPGDARPDIFAHGKRFWRNDASTRLSSFMMLCVISFS